MVTSAVDSGVERDVGTLRSQLRAWETSSCGDPVAAYHRGQLAGYLAVLGTMTRAEPDRRSAALLAALALGPRSTVPRGTGEIASLLQIACRTHAEIVDLVIAWGCGWAVTSSLARGGADDGMALCSHFPAWLNARSPGRCAGSATGSPDWPRPSMPRARTNIGTGW